MAMIELEKVNKYFGDNHVLKDVDLQVEDGDFMTFLGPSGCGKTTTLRVIVGLENPEEGIININDRTVVDAAKQKFVSPAKRNLSLVFQSYALWPHMTVYENVSFGLDVKKLSKPETQEKVKEALRRMQILDFIDRNPSELSGGQQQRVAIARAIVTEPRILLLDEPLSNLDAKLRLDMRAELKRLHQELKTTIIYVTHDQAEALTLSTKIAVFFEGRLSQVGTPREIYRHPSNIQVADFIGNPLINFIDAKCEALENGVLRTTSDLGVLDIPSDKQYNGDVKLAVYPEDVGISINEQKDWLPFTVYSVLPAGSETLIQLTIAKNVNITLKTMGEFDVSIGEKVWINILPKNINVYDKEAGQLVSQRET